MDEKIARVLISQEALAAKVGEIGAKISEDYAGKRPLLVSVLKGSIVFMADLMRAITIECDIDFMSCSSYGKGQKSSGVVRILKDLDSALLYFGAAARAQRRLHRALYPARQAGTAQGRREGRLFRFCHPG